MSGMPVFDPLPPHTSGTTWLGFALSWINEDGTPVDLTGTDFRMVGKSPDGVIAWDWHLSDPEKRGLSVPDPESGVLYVQGPGTLTLDAGVYSWDIKAWFVDGEVSVDIAGTLPIIDGKTP